MTTPERIKRLFELDGKRYQGAWLVRNHRNDCHEVVAQLEDVESTVCCDTDYYPTHVVLENQEFIAAAPEAVSIIKELLVVIEKQRSDFEALIIEAEGAANIYMAGELWQYCQKAKKQIALSAPYVNLLKE
jgi:hypothetical protein